MSACTGPASGMELSRPADETRGVWNWKGMGSWEPIVRELLRPQVTDDVIERLRGQRRE
jgi:hypothetical protein